LTVILMYFTARELFSREVARLSSLLCAFWPSLFLWSTQNLKEPLAIFFITLCFWALVRRNILSLPIIAVSILVLGKIRGEVAIIIVLSLFLYLVFLAYRFIRKDRFIFIITLLIVVPAVIYIAANHGKDIIGHYNPFKTGEFAVTEILSEVDYHRGVRSFANLAVLPGYRIESIGSLLRYMPLGMFFLLFAPFPWQIFNLSQVLAVPETIAWYFLVRYFIRGISFSVKNKAVYIFPILVYMIVSLLVLAILEGNVGTMFRHKAIALNFILLFVAAGLAGLKDNSVVRVGR